MKKKFARLLIVLLALTILTGIVGCGAKTETTTATTPAEPAPAEPAPAEPAPKEAEPALKPLDVKGGISVWYSGANESREEVYNWAKKKIEADGKATVTLEVIPFAELVQKQTIACKSGIGPDVMSQGVDATHGFMKFNLLLPIEELMKRAGRDIMAEINPNYFGPCTKDGVIYAIPQSRTAMALIYNKDMFKEAGLDPDKEPRTWDDLKEAAKLLTRDTNKDGKTDVFGLGMPANTPSHVWFRLLPEIINRGGHIANKELTTAALDTAATREALEYYCSYYFEGLSPESTLSIDNNEMCNMFIAGTLAMFFENPGAVYNKIVSKTDIDVGICARPGKEGPGMSMLGGWNIAIPASAKNPEGGAAFIDLVTSVEGMDMQLAMPTPTASIGKGKWAAPVWKPFAEIMNDPKAEPNPVFDNNSAAYDAIANMVQAVLSKHSSIDEAIIEANKKIQELLDIQNAG